MSLVPCHECGTEISDIAFSCPKCGAPSKDAIKQNKHTNTMMEHSSQLERIYKKNRVAKILIFALGLVYVMWCFSYGEIFYGIFCFAGIGTIILSNPYHYPIKKLKKRMKIETSFHDSIK